MSRGDRYSTGMARLIDENHDYGDSGIDLFGPPESWEKIDDDDARSAVAGLPHQCDSWIIGGEAEIQQLIADLQKCLESLRQKEIRE